MNDQTMLEQWIADRDAEAFRALVHAHSGMVFGACHRVLGDASEAEDVAQECFATLAQVRKYPKGYLGPWLHRVATNLSLKRVRSDMRRRKREREFATEYAEGREAQWDDLFEFVDKAIDELPDKLRAPLVAHFLEGQSQTEIARTLHTPRQTITNRIHSGLERIRRSLKRNGIGVTSVALGGMLGANAAEAAPVTLVASLGKLALAATGSINASLPTGIVALGGTLVMKKIVFVVVGLLTIAALYWTWAKPIAPQSVPKNDIAVVAAPVAESVPEATPEQAEEIKAEETLTQEDAIPLEYGAISGRVYDAKTDVGIPNVRIGLRGISQHTANWNRIPNTLTDAGGNYTLDDVPPDQWNVLIAHKGDIQAYQDPDIRKVHVTQGDIIEYVDFALHQGITIAGIVVGRQNKPIPNATVSASARRPKRWDRTTTSRSDGTFVLAGIPPTRTQEVQAKLSGSQGIFQRSVDVAAMEDIEDVVIKLLLRSSQSIAGRVVNLAGNPVKHGEVMLRGRENRGERVSMEGTFSISLHAGHYALAYREGRNELVHADLAQINLAPGEALTDIVLRVDVHSLAGGLTISGRVTNRQREPLVDAHVMVYDSKNYQQGETKCDSDGFYVLSDLIEGLYTVRVASNPYSQSWKEDVEAGASGVNFVLGKAGSIIGQVLRADTRAPVTEFEVDYDDNILGYTWLPLPVYDPEGRFELAGLQVDNRTRQRFIPKVIINAPGFMRAVKEVHMVSLEDGPVDVTILLKRGSRIEGVVIDPNGERVPGADLFLNKVPDGHSVYDTERASLGKSAQDGTFVVESMRPGVHTIWAVHPWHGMKSVDVETGAGDTHRVTIAFTDTGAVQGLVTLQGDPVVGAQVWVRVADDRQDPRNRSLYTDTEGQYRFPGGMPVGELHITASVFHSNSAPIREMYGATRMEIRSVVDVTGKESAIVDFAFPLGNAGVEGYITRDGEPVADARVATGGAYQGDWAGWAFETRTDIHGYYLMEGLHQANLGLSAFADSGTERWRASSEGQAYDGQITRIDLELNPK